MVITILNDVVFLDESKNGKGNQTKPKVVKSAQPKTIGQKVRKDSQVRVVQPFDKIATRSKPALTKFTPKQQSK